MKKSITTIEKWLYKVEEILESDTKTPIFLSEYGKRFNNDYKDLIDLNILVIFPKTFSSYQDLFGENVGISKINELIDELLKFVIKQAKLPKEKRKLAKIHAEKIRKKIDEVIVLGKQKLKEFESLFEEFDDILGEKKNETEDKTQKEEGEREETTQILDEINFLQRLNAYFLFALYSIIDVYCLSFLQNTMAIIPQKEFHDSLKELQRRPSNPKDTLNKTLDMLSNKDTKLRQIREKLISKLKWELHQDTFNSLKEVRDVIAHGKPCLSLTELEEKFKKHKKKAKRDTDEFFSELRSSELPESLKQLFLGAIEDIWIGFLLNEIGDSCVKYLALNEAIMQYVNDADEFLIHTAVTVKENKMEK